MGIKSIQISMILVAMLLLCCVGKKEQPVINDRNLAIDVVNNYHICYNKEDTGGLKKLYGDEFAPKRINKKEINSQIYAEQFELGVIKKSRLISYKVYYIPGRMKTFCYQLVVENQYKSCQLIEIFELQKTPAGKLTIADRQLEPGYSRYKPDKRKEALHQESVE